VFILSYLLLIQRGGVDQSTLRPGYFAKDTRIFVLRSREIRCIRQEYQVYT